MHGRKDTRLLHRMSVLKRRCPWAKLDGFVADLSLMSEVRELASVITERHPCIHGVLLNAASIDGGNTGRKVLTRDENELTLAVNTLSPFLLTSLLMDNLRASGAGRVILSSAKRLAVPHSLDDLQCEHHWSGSHAYVRSKLIATMAMAELHERYGDAPKLCFHAVDPGFADTNLMRQGGAWGTKRRRDRLRKQKLPAGLLPLPRTATASWEALTENAFQEASGRTVEGAPPEVHDAAERAELWERLVELTGAEWPEPNAASA
mmetsp:Transcript_79885/g.258805  ORF Transcript_79885/g.258805 Transcript_79885/m.258805 type:complete len:263 (-) Transcript_79885:113-901(-)